MFHWRFVNPLLGGLGMSVCLRMRRDDAAVNTSKDSYLEFSLYERAD